MTSFESSFGLCDTSNGENNDFSERAQDGYGRFAFRDVDTDSIHKCNLQEKELVIKATDLIHYRFNLIRYTDAKPNLQKNRTL